MGSAFEMLGLMPEFVQVVEKLGFEQPTPIQLAAIPALIEGRNVIGQAQTGTGKTAAFVLPMLQGILERISAGEMEKGVVQALVMAPTRELAIQVAEAAGSMAQISRARVLAVYGGQSYQIQIRGLKRGVEVVVGTPGRLLDLINQNILDLSHVRYLVLDEADEMLEMGFIEDVETIMAQLSEERQIALFSATLPEAIRRLADRYLSNPHQITINPKRITVEDTEQRCYRVREECKRAALIRVLEMEDVKSALIFARTKARAQELADMLIERGYPAESLHGDLSQARRETVLNRFRQRAITLLVATDVAARGLDIEDMSHVINFDAPADAEDYVHRIGRTGRAGRKGIAISFFTNREYSRQRAIEAYTRQSIAEFPMPSRDEVLARRDERFLERLTEQVSAPQLHLGRKLAERLAGRGLPMADIAAAAIQLVRAQEGELALEEILAPVDDRRPARARSGANRGDAYADTRPARDGKRERFPAGAFEGSTQGNAQGNAQHPRQPGMIRLRMNLGKAQGLRPGDVVGAIASEVGIPGRAIGEIDIYRDHTFVDVSEKHAQQVLSESGGKYSLRGRPVTLTLVN